MRNYIPFVWYMHKNDNLVNKNHFPVMGLT